jgi:hypothetical protein
MLVLHFSLVFDDTEICLKINGATSILESNYLITCVVSNFQNILNVQGVGKLYVNKPVRYMADWQKKTKLWPVFYYLQHKKKI